MPDTLVATAIATSVGVIVVAALITITMALCFIRAQRDQPQSKRVSVITPVIDICRPAHSNVDWDSRIVAPQRPREALLSSRQPSPGIPTASRYSDASRQTGSTGSCSPSGSAKMDLDLESQIWQPSREKKYVKTKRSHALSHIFPSVELPISPPPSYSQIDKSILVAGL